MIKLTEFEKLITLYSKHHKLKSISDELSFFDGLEILYSKHFYYDIENPNRNKLEFKFHMFNIMYDLLLKIYDGYDIHKTIKEIFEQSFFKNPFGNDYELPVERSLFKIRNIISMTTVVNDDKSERFSLTLDDPSLIEKRE